jgi:hypothetical protein
VTDLAALKEAAKAATPGPWKPLRNPGASGVFRKEPVEHIATTFAERQKVDAAFIALANPAAILDLIGLAEELAEAADEHLDICPVGARRLDEALTRFREAAK